MVLFFVIFDNSVRDNKWCYFCYFWQFCQS